MTERDEIRELATELAKPTLSFDPANVRKGIVQSIQVGPPPTVTVRLSGSSVDIPGVAYTKGYTPIALETVLILKVDSALTVLDSYPARYPENETVNDMSIQGVLSIGADCNLFRSAANMLRTNDGLIVDGALSASTVTATTTVTGVTVAGTTSVKAGANTTLYQSRVEYSGTNTNQVHFDDSGVGIKATGKVGVIYDRASTYLHRGNSTSATTSGLEGWNSLTMASGWASLVTCQYKLFPDGIVRLRGMTDGPATPAPGATVGTLPAGYRSTINELFPVCFSNVSTMGRVQIFTTGAIAIYDAPNGWMSFGGVSFSVI